MLYWVIYDISSTSTRNKVIRYCKKYGLRRVQKSAFLGDTTRNKIEMISLSLADLTLTMDDVIFIIPSCTSCFHSRIIHGKLDEKKILENGLIIVGEQ